MTVVSPETPIAIVGMACRLPGAANIEQFWDLLRAGRQAIGPAPAERLDRQLYYDPRRGLRNKTYSDLAAVVSYGPVDRQVCPIQEEVAARYDVAHVTLCEVAAAACRHAGLDPAGLEGRNAGVYVGHAAASGLAGKMTYATWIRQTARYLRETAGFDQLAAGLQERVIQEIVDRVRQENPHRAADGSPLLGASLAAGLIARTFGLSGPYMSFNSACASSLQALVQAVRALQLGRIEMALVGGASYFHSDTLVLFAAAQSMSTRGSAPFTADADGMIVAEGYVTLVLKTLPQALADGDAIQAVIPSLGISSDGHGKSLWAPRAEGQVEAIRRAYGPGVSMERLGYIEAHATSTPLGDVTEIQALSQVLAPRLPAGCKVPIGSVKFNIGHTLESAGLTGLLKVVLALQHQVIPPTTDGRALNSQIDWDQAPVYPPSRELPWAAPADGAPRRAAVNAFGIGGLNVHVVVDEYQGDGCRVPREEGRVSSVGGGAVSPRHPAPVALPSVSPDDNAVAIVGMGAVLPGARTLEAYWDLLATGRDARCEFPPERLDIDCFHQPGASGPWTISNKLGGFVTGFEYDWRKHRIPPKQIAQASPLQFMILDAVDQAMQQARYSTQKLDRSRAGVVVGNCFGGDFSAQLVIGLKLPDFQQTLDAVLARHGVPPAERAAMAEAYARVLLRHMPALLDETGSFTSSALASRITKAFDLMGGAVAVDAGNGSSLAALSCCVDLLVSRTCDLMVCVGAQQDMTPSMYEGLGMGGLLAAGRPPAPLDAQAAGVVPGEGCGVLLLKRLADARRDGDAIHGIIRGVAAACSRDHSQAVALSIERALQSAGVDLDDVAALETTGTGRRAVDACEVQGIARAYAARQADQPLLLGTVVGQIGYTAGASGMASLLKAALALGHDRLPGTGGGHQPAEFVSHQPRLEANFQPRSLTPGAGRAVVAGVSAGGPGEAAYHVLLERGAEIVSRAVRREPPDMNVHRMTSPAMNSSIVFFDATAARRDRMRRKAAGQPEVPPVPSQARPQPPAAPPAAAPRIEPRIADRPVRPAGSNGDYSAPAAAPAASRLAEPVRRAQPSNGVPAAAARPAPVAVAAAVKPAPSQAPAVPAGNASPQELLATLVNFVVEHTGYPESIVELDVDLEVDLGIDSIEKAQLFGELAQRYALPERDDLSLEDFPTLRHVLDYLTATVGGAAAVAAPPAPSPAAAPAADTPSQTDAGELEAFLVNFVVEQTGYPASIVELDADLEADLGIDSIKKAQLFGELAQYFPIQASDDLSLDDFPTLRHVLNFLKASVGGSNGAPIAPPAAAPAAPPVAVAVAPVPAQAQPQADAGELEAFLVNFVVEQTGYPASIVELDADLEADLGIDSIKKAQLFGELAQYFPIKASDDLSLDDFPTLRHVLEFLKASVGGSNGAPVAPPAAAPAAVPAALPAAVAPAPARAQPQADAGELEAFLVNFVVEQTGYPASIVELDADLEADLGIDSIKKAQLFGELAQYFPIKASDDLSLDDFPTLRHVLNFLVASVGGSNGAPVAPPAAAPAAAAVAVAPAPAQAQPQAEAGELEAFLVNFVVEQTGYPASIVELDADLEADLGIDSIKKAQLFGELAQYFPIKASDDLSLDDFPTLRHVLNFLVAAVAGTTGAQRASV